LVANGADYLVHTIRQSRGRPFHAVDPRAAAGSGAKSFGASAAPLPKAGMGAGV
jgi:hypothetical protein